jgi:hypothetical protein
MALSASSNTRCLGTGVALSIAYLPGLGCCLLVGLRSSPAPGDRVSPGRLDAGAVKGRPAGPSEHSGARSDP